VPLPRGGVGLLDCFQSKHADSLRRLFVEAETLSGDLAEVLVKAGLAES
jgi:hypothetical protein